jgi:hypothetical protein
MNFPTEAYDLPSHKFLSLLTVPNMGSFPWNGTKIQLDYCFLNTYYSRHYCTGGHILQGMLKADSVTHGITAKQNQWQKFFLEA